MGAFGMGEGLLMLTPPDAHERARHHTSGYPVSKFDETRLLDPESESDVSPGEVGELVCRGPYTLRGYLGADEHNRTAFTSDGFYRTGDLARIEAVDGSDYFQIRGRIKDMISRGGEKVNAEELEELLVEHEAIAHVAVVAMPDREYLERVCAFVVPAPDCSPTLEELCTFLLDRGLAKFKLPERLELVDDLPLTGIQKVSKVELRARIAARLEEEASS